MKKYISIFISIFLLIINLGCNSNISKEQVYQNILQPLTYSLGQNNWDKAEDISPDAFVVFYFTLPLIDELAIPEDYGIDKTYGNPLIPADDLETTVQKYFDFHIPKDYIKKSQYYDKDLNSYFTGGIGSTINIEIKEVEIIDNELSIVYNAWINYGDNWNGTVNDILNDNGEFKYQSFSTNRVVDWLKVFSIKVYFYIMVNYIRLV